MDAPAFTLSTSDRAFLRALRRQTDDPSASFWSHLAPSWRVALRSAWEETYRRTRPEDAARSLADDHRDETIPDPRRIHPSWYLRALRDESPAVRRAVARHESEPISGLLRSAMTFDDDEAVPPHPDALRWVLDFWTERLVGGPPLSPGDPPVIHILTTMSRSSLLRLMVTCGHVKRADSPIMGRRDLADLGRITIGRLLTRAEPYRARWALQHLPYKLAALLRKGIETPVLDAQIDQEGRNLQTALDRLHAEGRRPTIPEAAR